MISLSLDIYFVWYSHGDAPLVRQPALVVPGRLTAVPINDPFPKIVARGGIPDGEGPGVPSPAVLPRPVHGEVQDLRGNGHWEPENAQDGHDLCMREVLHHTGQFCSFAISSEGCPVLNGIRTIQRTLSMM